MEDPSSCILFCSVQTGNAGFNEAAYNIFIIRLLVVLLLQALGGLFYGAYMVLSSFNKVRVRELVEEKISQADILLKLLENRRYSLLSLLMAKLFIIFLADNLLNDIMGHYFSYIEASFFTSLIMVVAILFYGEIICRIIITYNTEGFALSIARPVMVIFYLFYIFSWIVVSLSSFIARLFGIGEVISREFITQDDIRLLVEEGKEQGVFEEKEKEMIHSIIEFGDTIAREIMVPRISMVSMAVDESLDNVVNSVLETGYSRIPIYEETIDNIVGIVYTKDMLKLLKEDKTGITIRTLMRPAYFTPEIKKVDDLLREMQQKRISMAIVVDEYGGTDGLVTIEDIIEEIVGEIEDEYDKTNPVIEEIGQGTFIVDARMNIEDVNSRLDISLPIDECETIGGFVYGLLGRIPSQGEKVKVDSISIVVEKIHRRMIKKVKIDKFCGKEKDKSEDVEKDGNGA